MAPHPTRPSRPTPSRPPSSSRHAPPMPFPVRLAASSLLALSCVPLSIDRGSSVPWCLALPRATSPHPSTLPHLPVRPTLHHLTLPHQSLAHPSLLPFLHCQSAIIVLFMTSYYGPILA